MIHWQTVLLDERPDQAGLRWPPSWVAGNDYVHRTGPVLMRSSRGREYLTSDVVYVDLDSLISLMPANQKSPLYGRPSYVAKRLHPLDPYNRAFSLSITFQIAANPEFRVIRSLQQLPSTNGAEGPVVSGHEIAQWVSDLKVFFRPGQQICSLYELGSALGSHLRRATQGAVEPNSGEKFSAVGHAVLLSARMYFMGEPSREPDLVVDKPPGIHGRPFVAMANSNGSSAARRRLRTYALRTFAEIDVANYIYGHLSKPDSQSNWQNRRGMIAVDYLSRSAPYGLSGEAGRKMWQLSVSRRGARIGDMRRIARDRLAPLLSPVTLGEQAGSVVIVENSYTFNGPVGAAGTNARGLLMISGSQVDASQLAQELERLSKYLSDRDPEDSDVPVLTEAAHDAREGNSAGAGSKLRRVSRQALSAANDLALAVAGAVIAHAIGV